MTNSKRKSITAFRKFDIDEQKYYYRIISVTNTLVYYPGQTLSHDIVDSFIRSNNIDFVVVEGSVV